MMEQTPQDYFRDALPGKPRCPVFGECGGCQYQDRTYKEELAIKEGALAELFVKELEVDKKFICSIVPSPCDYHYRNRLDLRMKRVRDGRHLMGFSPVKGKFVVEIDQCPIAIQSISDYLPQLKKEAIARWPDKYCNANLVIRTGDDCRVVWGGIGRRSTRLEPEDYLWTQIGSLKIFYSLDTFFQANLSILPDLIQNIKQDGVLNKEVHFFDLYGGVGFFGMCLAHEVSKVTLIEENIHAVKMAQYNCAFNKLDNFTIIASRLEEQCEILAETCTQQDSVAFVDPPRAGLSAQALQVLTQTRFFKYLYYLSCNPETLVENLKVFKNCGWKIVKVTPFDFFPRTKHLETLVLLESPRET